MSILNQMNQAMKEAKEASSKSVFLMITASGEQRRIRFLYDLDNGPNNQAITMKRHVVYDNKVRKYVVDTVCGAEVGKACRYCALAASNKLYTVKTHFILPVFVYGQEGGEVKLIELRPTQTILPTLISYYSEEGSIKGADFIYTRNGEGKDTKYTLIPKAPKPFAVTISKPLAEERIRAKVLEAFPYIDDQDEDETPVVTPALRTVPSLTAADLTLDDAALAPTGTEGISHQAVNATVSSAQVINVPNF